MAITAIFRPQEGVLHPNRFPRDPNTNSCPKPGRPRRRKRSPTVSPDGRPTVATFPAKNLVPAHVQILKRGEDPTLASVAVKSGADDLVLCSTDRLGPEPEMVQKQIKVPDLNVVDRVYAGSAVFLASPPPSSLPLPAFFASKEKNAAATSDLRRMLGLDLI